MAKGPVNITMDDREVQRMLGRLLNKIERPAPLMKQIQRYVNAVTMKMFRGKRPDNSEVRGVKWGKLSPMTIKNKKAAGKRGVIAAGASPNRPLVRTGKMRDSLRVLESSSNGFVYGTKIKSKKGFPYPAAHNVGGKKTGRPPARPWLFLSRDDFRQIVSMTVDFLEGVKHGHKSYVKK